MFSIQCELNYLLAVHVCSSPRCAHNHHCITLTLKKTYKHEDSQRSSEWSMKMYKWIYGGLY